jgi:dTMP kinase
MRMIDFEGIDGVGKTSALKYVVAKLREQNFRVLETREVGNPHLPVAVKLREIVLNPESGLDGIAMEFIFSAMRAINRPFFEKEANNYDFLINDRGWFSHLAYTDNNVSPEFTNDLYAVVRRYTYLPDQIVYLTARPEVALSRRTARGTSDIIEMKGPEFQNRVAESFAHYISESNIPAYHVDANGDLASVQKQLDAFVELLKMDFLAANVNFK